MSTCRSLFNLEGAIERLCTFKCGKEKDKFRGPCINRKVEIWGCSSAGRAPALQAGGQEFESPYLHLIIQKALNYQMEKTLGIYSQKSFSFDKRIFFEYP